jgi:hypothetical protein
MSMDDRYRRGGAPQYLPNQRPGGGPPYSEQGNYGQIGPQSPSYMGATMNREYGSGAPAINYLSNNAPSGNAYRDAWLAERSESELRRLDALAASEGLKLQPATILRPILIADQVQNFTGGASVSLNFYFPFYAYIRKVTSSVRHLEFKAGQAPDSSTVGQLDTREYVEAKIVRSSGEQLFNEFVSLDQVSGDGSREYIFDLIPFVTRAETISVQLQCNTRVETIDQVQITLHCMRFPVEGV